MLPEYVYLSYDGKNYPINSAARIDDLALYNYLNFMAKRYPCIFYRSYKMPVHFMPLSFMTEAKYVASLNIAQDSFFIETRFDDMLNEIFSEEILPYPSIVSGILFSETGPISYILHLKAPKSLDFYFCTHHRRAQTIGLNSYTFLTEALEVVKPIGENFDIKAIFHIEPVAFEEYLSLAHVLLSLEYLIEHFPVITPPAPRLVTSDELKFNRALVHFVHQHQPCERKTIASEGFFKASSANISF